jgi:ribonuclease P protein component
MERADAGGSRGAERFPKQRRLRKRREFVGVQQRGRKIHLDDVLVLYTFTARGRPSRLGVTVSRKVGNAVHRNRVKRLVREVWRRSQRFLPEGYDMVIIAKRSATSTTYARLVRQLLQLPRRLGHGSARR